MFFSALMHPSRLSLNDSFLPVNGLFIAVKFPLLIHRHWLHYSTPFWIYQIRTWKIPPELFKFRSKGSTCAVHDSVHLRSLIWFSRPWHWLHFLPRTVMLTWFFFLTLDLRCMFPAFSDDCSLLLCLGCFWLDILPRLRPVQLVCFNALLIAWLWRKVFSHLSPATCFRLLVQRRKNETKQNKTKQILKHAGESII